VIENVEVRDYAPLSGAPRSTVSVAVPATQLELVVQGLVTGKPWLVTWGGGTAWPWPGGMLPSSAFSVNEFLELGGLALMLLSYTETDANGNVCTTEYYHGLETTEKGQASARLGVAMTGLLAWKLVGVAALYHVATAASGLGFGGNHRPDFVGEMPGATGWGVFESKGTCADKATTTLSRKAKTQAAAVISVLSTTPAVSVGVIALLRTTANPIHAQFRDPPPEEVTPIRLDELDELALEERRYGPLVRAITAGRASREQDLPDGVTARLFELPGVGYLGVARPVAEAIEREAPRTSEEREEPRRRRFAIAVRDARREVAATLEDRRGTPIRRDAVVTATPPPEGNDDVKVNIAGEAHELAITGDGIVLAVRRSLLRK
jgi:hypothetical protein